jgi:uncharacterized membrane protein
MSQIPPPPPGQPAPMGGPPVSAGSNKNLYTILAWVLFPPIGSLIFLFVGKDDPDVKYNAAEAVIIHGVFFVVAVIIGIVFIPIYPIRAFIWFIVWVIGLILAFQANGSRVNFPVLGPMVAQYVPTVEGWAK